MQMGSFGDSQTSPSSCFCVSKSSYQVDLLRSKSSIVLKEKAPLSEESEAFEGWRCRESNRDFTAILGTLGALPLHSGHFGQSPNLSEDDSNVPKVRWLSKHSGDSSSPLEEALCEAIRANHWEVAERLMTLMERSARWSQ
jgi:hypothetical protein